MVIIVDLFIRNMLCIFTLAIVSLKYLYGNFKADRSVLIHCKKRPQR